MAKRTSKKSAKKVVNRKAAAKKKPTGRRPSKKAVKKAYSGTCFVMMPFADPFDIYYEGLYRPAIEAANLKPVRADDLFRPSMIVADLWEMIQKAKVLLAELTTKNANVFYELGLAHAIGKPVVLVSETMDDVPFDLQQLRVISYDKDDPAWGDKLAGDVTAALTETLTAPVKAVPSTFRTPVESQGPEQDKTEARFESLERQLRLLRSPREGVRVGPSGVHEAVRHLRGVSNQGEFENWVHSWSRRLPLSLLQSLASESDSIPAGAEEEIPRIVRIDRGPTPG